MKDGWAPTAVVVGQWKIGCPRVKIFREPGGINLLLHTCCKIDNLALLAPKHLPD